jgi:hypothetical protein
MSRHYVLVDFENVQPASLGALKEGADHVKVFTGQHQSRVDIGLAAALQRLGTNAEYIQIVGSGKDALDFHIAFYIGKLAAEHPDATFTIVSKDTGFDPLRKHLETLGIKCNRVTTLPGASVRMPAAKQAAPAKKAAPAKQAAPAKTPAKVAKAPAKKAARKAAAPPPPPRLQEVIQRLHGMKKAKPGTVKTMSSWLAAFNPPFAAAEIPAMLQALQQAQVFQVEGTKIVHPA